MPEQDIAREAGLPDNWYPIEAQPIIPGQTPPMYVSRDVYQSGQLPPLIGLQPDLTKAGEGVPAIPSVRLMPVAPSGLAQINAAIKSASVPTITQPVIVSSGFYDIIFSLAGKPNWAFTYPWIVFDRSITFASGLAGSAGAVLANPTSTTTFTVNKNGSSVGTIIVATSGAVSFTGGFGAVSGDVLTLLTPSSDPTLAGIMFILAGTVNA